MAKEPTVLGKMLGRLHFARRMSHDQAVSELWKRNNLTTNQDGYKLAETKQINRDGTEITEYRLYKLIDASVVTISAEITSKVEVGLEHAKEMYHHKKEIK